MKFLNFRIKLTRTLWKPHPKPKFNL
jgi:hypothetical protein